MSNQQLYSTPGYALAMRVMQSGFYAKLDDRERAECDALIAAGQGTPQQEPLRQDLIEWVAARWHAEVANRPIVNVHRRSLDDAWRQVLSRLGVDHRVRLGPTHDELRAEITSKEWEAMYGAPARGREVDLIARGMGWEQTEQLMREACAQAGVEWGEDQKPQDIAINVMQRLANAAHKVGFRLGLDRATQAAHAWRPIAEAPEGQVVVVGWRDEQDTENPDRQDFDYLEDGVWTHHADSYEYFRAVACAGENIIGPSERAPYTHFMAIGPVPKAIP